jgi:hypothetical protein
MVMLLASVPGVTMAAPTSSSSAALAATPSPDADTTLPARKNPYAARSDEELTVLAANWDALGQTERRALLTEMKRRMARKGDHSGVIRIRTERRYGRIIRQPDGRVIRIETQVVHVRPLDEGDIEQARQGYGVGFERRVARRGEAEALSPEQPDDTRGRVSIPSDVFDVLEDLQPPPLTDPLPVYRASDPAP